MSGLDWQKVRSRQSLAFLFALLSVSVSHAQQIPNNIVLEPAVQSQPIFAPIYSLFGMLPTQATSEVENAPKFLGIQSQGEIASPVLASPAQIVQRQIKPTLVAQPEPSVNHAAQAMEVPNSEETQEPKALSLAPSDNGLVSGELLPAGYVQFPGVMLSEPNVQLDRSDSVSTNYLSDSDSEFNPESLERSIANLEKDIHRRENTWKQLVGAAADGRSKVEVSAAQEQAKLVTDEAEERLREYQSSSEQALDDVRRAAAAQKARSETKIAYAARSVGPRHRPPRLLRVDRALTPFSLELFL